MLSGAGLEPLQRVLDLGLQPFGELAAFEIVDADVAGDGKTGRDRNADGGHLGQTSTLAAENVFHGRGPFGAALTERVDQRLGVRTAHAGVAIRGVACRRRTGSSGVGVGYMPEKQA